MYSQLHGFTAHSVMRAQSEAWLKTWSKKMSTIQRGRKKAKSVKMSVQKADENDWLTSNLDHIKLKMSLEDDEKVCVWE